MASDRSCVHCSRPIYWGRGDKWRHRDYHTNNSTFCDQAPWQANEATPGA